jgi:alkanesulfonate monooxygenase SsuD/methylene tetrahydromethanopterin reductase-like flavin-dependent oxidoreductase (luciferase family)
MAGVLIGRDEAEMASRVSAAVRTFGSGADDRAWLDERLERWITGTPDQARDAVRRFEAVGAQRIMLQDMLPWDLDMIDVMGEVLVGQV